MKQDSHVDGVGVSSAASSWRDSIDVVRDVDELAARFSAESLSVAAVLCDDHLAVDTAFTLVDAEAHAQSLTYGELANASRRLAAGLAARGIGEGDRVAVLLSKTRELPIVLLAIWRLGAVHVPLFTAFAGPAIDMRVIGAGAKLIITEPGQSAKVEGLGVGVLLTGEAFEDLLTCEPISGPRVAVGGDGLIVQLYTSGTTGTPKAIGIPARAIGSFVSYMRYGLGVEADDVFWNAADPGWAYGLYHGIIGPLATGRANVLLGARFSADLTREVMEKVGVTNFAAALTVYRALRADGVHLEHGRPRRASSAGEPRTPDVTAWAPTALGSVVPDHYGQTEHGMVIVNAWHDALRAEVLATPWDVCCRGSKRGR